MGFPARDAMTLLDHGETNRLGQVALARPGRPLQESVLVLGHEPAGDELGHEPAVHLLVEVEVEGVEGLPTSAETRLLDAALEPVLAAPELVLDERREEVNRNGSGSVTRQGSATAA